MTDNLMQIIHEAYQIAVKKSTTYDAFPGSLGPAMPRDLINGVEVCKRLYCILENQKVETQEDEQVLDYFLNKLQRTIAARKNTYAATNMCSEILFVTMLIVAWLNHDESLGLDVNMTARRKAVESELAKNLDMADHSDAGQLFDRFGIRCITLNPDNEIKLTFYMIKGIIEILCNLNRCHRKRFIRYVETNPNIGDFSKERVKKILEIPFVLEPANPVKGTEGFDINKYPHIKLPTEAEDMLLEKYRYQLKNYIKTPKSNAYQSIHFVISIDPSYVFMPGFYVEFQFRTWAMHYFAENDKKASHKNHKEGVREYSKVFSIDDFDGVGIRGFANYNSPENDIDGIHYPKVFYNRRMKNRISI